MTATATATVTPIAPVADPAITCARSQLQRALRSAYLFACTDSTRFHLNGVRLEADITEDPIPTIALVATDGHALIRIRIPGRATGKVGVTIARADVRRMIDHLKGPDGEAKLTVGATSVEYEAPGIMGRAAKAEGRDSDFPPYDQLLAPKKVRTRGDVKKELSRKKKGVTEHDPFDFAIGLDPELVILVGRAARYLGRKKGSNRGLEMRVGCGDLEPVRFDYSDPDELLELAVVVMPMRI